jgi:molybdopterin-guanine dinucleotide biosynthesis protein B
MRVIGIVGWKNCGKTTLVGKLISELSRRGLTVSSIKHAHHKVDVDQPGTDSYHHREAGAREVILAGGQRIAIMQELRGASEPTLDELLARLSPCDWVVVEGFKSHPHPKIEVHRQTCPRAPLYPIDPTIIGVATDYAADFAATGNDLPGLDLNDIHAIADFIQSQRQPSTGTV